MNRSDKNFHLRIKNLTNGLIRSELLRNASLLITGTVIAQTVAIILQPVLRRLYPAEVFGVYSVYMSIIGILSVVGSLRYEDAIVLPRKDKDSMNIVFMSLILNFVISILITFIIIFFGSSIFKFLNIPDSFPFSVLYLIPLSVFLYNSFQYLNFWLIRKKRFGAVSVNKVARRGTEGIFQIIFAVSRNPRGLIFSDIAGHIANIFMATIQSIRNGFTLKYVSIGKIKYLATKYSDFPKYNLVTSLAGTCSFMLPPLFINKFYSSEVAGYFDLARVMLSIPVIFLTTAFSSVILQKVTEKFNNGESFIGDLKKILLIVLPVAFIEIVLIFFFGEDIFLLIGGPQNQYSGTIARILVWSVALNFIVSSFTSVFISLRKIRLYSLYQIFYFSAILILLAFRRMEFPVFLKTYVLIEVVCYLVLITTLIMLVLKHERSIKTVENIK